MPPGENVLTAALAAGIPLPYSCRAGRCATCKSRVLAGVVDYPGGVLPPGIVAAEAAKGEALLCQARPKTDLRIAIRMRGAAETLPMVAVSATSVAALSLGAQRVTLQFVGAAALSTRSGQFVDIETADDSRERVAVVAVGAGSIDVEIHELQATGVVRASGPYDTPR